MYPILRLTKTVIRSLRQPSLDVEDTCETTFRCMPWDIDMFMEMNNGRVLTLYDLGRFDLAIRTGLAKVLKDRNWGLVVASSTIRYRRRIRVFDKMVMKTRVAGFEDRWIYIEQSIWVNDRPCSAVLLRTGVTEAGKALHSDQVKEVMKLEDFDLKPSDWVEEWITTEDDRPWPPEH